MKRILAAVDFSPVTTKVVNKAAQLCLAFNGKLWLVHVADPDPDFVGYQPGPPSVRANMAKQFRQEHRRLQQRAARLEARGIPTTPLLIQGSTQNTLIREVKRLKADLLIIGSHRSSPLRRFLVGDIAKSLVGKTPCPILVIPEKR